MKASPTVLCVATNVNENLLGWVRSLNRCNFSYRILGLGETWGGWSWRALKYVSGLKAFDPDDVVIICDAYDLFAVKPSHGMLAKFLRLDVDIIAGAEFCTGENVASLEDWYQFHDIDVHPKLPHLNAGFVMGKVSRLIEMYGFISQREDDQIAMGEYFRTYPHRLAVDFNRMFVYNHQYVLEEEITDAHFIHYPGYKYRPETTVAFMNRLREMLADETDSKAKDIVPSEETNESDFSLQNNSVTQDVDGACGLCTLQSICHNQGSDNELDALVEVEQMPMSLDQLAGGMFGRAVTNMACNLEQGVHPSTCHVLEAAAVKVDPNVPMKVTDKAEEDAFGTEPVLNFHNE